MRNGDMKAMKEFISAGVEKGLVLVSGSVPGLNGGFLRITDAIKHSRPDKAPYPAALRTDTLPKRIEKEHKDEKYINLHEIYYEINVSIPSLF